MNIVFRNSKGSKSYLLISTVPQYNSRNKWVSQTLLTAMESPTAWIVFHNWHPLIVHCFSKSTNLSAHLQIHQAG